MGDRAIGTISGIVYEDINGNQIQDSGESGIGGVTIQLINSTTSEVDAEATTAGDGSYIFSGVTASAYIMQEIDPEFYTSTTANQVSVNMISGGAANANFGDRIEQTVSGIVYEDRNGNQRQDEQETGIGDVAIELRNSETGETISNTTTATGGFYQFSSIPAGAYLVIETDPTGFTSTTLNTVLVNLSAEESVTANFGDRAIGTITGTVFDDLNGNGIQDSGELGIGGVLITVDPRCRRRRKCNDTYVW